jgi:putative N6-adenine-specific DNA methylase
MSDAASFEIFLVAIPGLEKALLDEAQEAGFRQARIVKGGVAFDGNWQNVWRANYMIRGASRVLARIGSFRAMHLAQLDKRARAFPWASVLRADIPVAVEAACSRSRIYHSGAAADRVGRAISEELGAPLSEDADVTVKLRVDQDLCTISIDTSGDHLHKRGHKRATAKAPMRETMASLLLRQCGYTGMETVLDPLCGSGTIVIEAAEIAAGLAPGRNRSFAFEKLATFNAESWQAMRSNQATRETAISFYGSDRDAGAIKAAKANAGRAGVGHLTHFEQKAISDVQAPEGPPGLVLMNPPYGARIGDKRRLLDLHEAIGRCMKERFRGWRIALVTSDDVLARATGLPFSPRSAPILHGGLRVYLYQTEALA